VLLGYSLAMRTASTTIARARTPSRAGLALALAVVLGIIGAGDCIGAPTPTPTALRPAPVVAILLSPFLTYADLSPSTTPALWSLAENGAVGSMNAITADPGWPTVAGGALTLSAGRWAAAATSGPAHAASLPRQQAANDASLARPLLGALGEALSSAGGLTAAVGASDPGVGAAVAPLRPADLVATDTRGRVDVTYTGEDLLSADPRAPFGVRTNRARLDSAIASALAEIESSPNPGGLLVVDPGDLSRAHAAASRANADDTGIARAHTEALISLDAAAADLARRLPPDSLLLVVTPTTDKPYYQPPYFGPIIASGRGLSGLLTSPSTHRPGLVTNLDVAPTALAALGIPAPSTMIGRPLSARPDSGSLAEKLGVLERTGATVGAVDKLRDRYFTPSYAWLAVLCVAIAVLAAFRPERWLRSVGGILLLGVLCAPPAAWLALLVVRHPGTTRAAALAFGVAWLATFAAAVSVAKLVRAEAALAALAADTVLLVMIDQWVGGPLQTGLFSYSIRAGWRYYGIGNEGAALAVGAALTAVGLGCDLAAGTRWALPLRRYSLPFVGAIVLTTATAPFAGANAGVAVWGFIAFAAAWLRMNRVPFSGRAVLGTIAAIALLVGGLVAFDLLGVGGGTHIGRFLLEFAGGGSGAWELISRKGLNNIRYVTQTPYSWLALTIALALLIERFVRPRPLIHVLERFPMYARALTGVVVGGVAAMLTEDSGIVMPALMLLAGALPALHLALLPRPGTARASE
jgi:hypothetical protein